MSPFIGLADVVFRRDGTMDDEAVAILVRAVEYAARRAGRRREEDDDLLHDLLLKLLGKRRAAEGEGRAEDVRDENKLFWSCVRVAENHLIDQFRRTRRGQVEDPSVLDTQPGASSLSPDEDERELACYLLGPAPDDETPGVRVIRRLYQGESLDGIALTLKVSARTVRHLRSKGMLELRERFNRDAVDHPG